MHKESLIVGVVAALAIIALAAVAMPRGGGSPALVSHLAITGTASVNVVPDVGVVSLGISTRADTVAKAQAGNDAAMARVVRALTALGIAPKDIQTQGYNIMPTYGNGGVRTGYQVDDQVQVTVRKASLAGSAISAATGAGANEVMGVSWQVSNPTRYSAEAYAQALQNARTTAQRLARSMGVTLLGIDAVSVVAQPSPVPLNMAFKAADAASAPIQVGSQPVTTTLRVVFNYR